jgi:glutathione S-transferase
VGSKPFLAGEKPNLGDLAVYACIRAIEGMDAHKVSRDEQALKSPVDLLAAMM